MSSEHHLENWAKIKGAALNEIPVKVASYALVAVSESGEVFWGADYSSHAEMLVRAMNQIRADITRHLSQKKADPNEPA